MCSLGNNNTRSVKLFEEAQSYIPGGVNSPVRAFGAVGGKPFFVSHGEGSRIYDVDGNSYIDYVGSWGPLILGHAHPAVVETLTKVARHGTSYGAPTEAETELARLLIEALPGVDMVRMVNSGTEATMSAIRLARAYTGRNKIVKFAGCYHGHVDALLVKAGSGATTFGVPTSPGVPEDVVAGTIVLPYNDPSAVENIFEKEGDSIAAVIVEPVAGNMGLVLPKPGFLESLREVTEKYNSLLIFDEVITGFRVAYGGAQSYFDVIPDLTCLGKIIGGGLPVGAYGGRKEIMGQVAPLGPVYQAGTLSGNPLAMAAGAATLKLLGEPGVYEELARKGKLLYDGLTRAVVETGAPVQVVNIGSMCCVFFTEQEVTDYTTAMRCNTEKYAAYFRYMLEHGVFIAPAQFEVMFVSLAHNDEDINQTVEIATEAFKRIF
ncbi:MAG: glutamate-1-semialdehyde 2,1-aminomutase [Peptococcaceae bacterium]|nr:glutamate-1-semialdehyde 2,1-aminomutase [Peptococcaceae bacterium]